MALATETAHTTPGLPVDRWRLITGYGMPGALNMALDEALLESVIQGGSPVVRFYTWEPATLSLGVNQPIGEAEPGECARRGFGLVRRITGGRAVLHQHELTYSVVSRENDPRVSGGVIESYHKISAALVAGFRALGADVELAAPNRALVRALAEARRRAALNEEVESIHGAVCFDAASAYELTARGRKLVGSAQARRHGALLQHGSILLDIDWDAWVSVFAYATDPGRERARAKLPARMTSLKEILGREITPQEVSVALRRGFEDALSVSLEDATPGEVEEASAKRLAVEKYGTDAWTMRV